MSRIDFNLSARAAIRVCRQRSARVYLQRAQRERPLARCGGGDESRMSLGNIRTAGDLKN